VLSSGAHGSGGGNETITSDEHALSLCGANFCVQNQHQNDNLERPPDSEIFEITIIYLACIFAAVAIIAVFVDPLSRYVQYHSYKNRFSQKVCYFKATRI